ncbi:hypothetical protein BDZ97DRAFT_1924099 [Flammula alnicola]|nr:hypothetical protein BDZ97DRAFT_1924099 [Flammula alnicola]
MHTSESYIYYTQATLGLHPLPATPTGCWHFRSTSSHSSHRHFVSHLPCMTELLDTASTEPPNTTAVNPMTEEGEARPEVSAASLPVEASNCCGKCVDEYRAGTLTKVQAFVRIQQIIAQYADNSQAGPAVAALESYLGMLDNFDWFRKKAAERGGEVQAEEVEHEEGEGSDVGNAQDFPAEHARPAKRDRSPDVDDEPDLGGAR